MAMGVALQAPFSLKHSGNFGKSPDLSQSTATANHLPHEMLAPPTKSGIHGARHQQAPSGMIPLSGPERGGNAATAIAPCLQIPSSINSSKGSLAEFAAQMACFFWFHATSKLNTVEAGLSQSVTVPVPSPEPQSIPSIGFRKWLTTMLSTTQVSQNVILLALLFIYRLKTSNPGVKGKRGSEFRLMTIALMMGNKFLDDATYLNKTWADVSGISIQEIHLMEVEFLSNIRYNLFVSLKEWNEWLAKLGLFSGYLDRSSRACHNEGAAAKPASQLPWPTPIPSSADYTRPALVPQLSNPPVPSVPDRPSHLQWNQSMAEQQYPLPTNVSSEPVNPLTRNRKRCWDGENDLHPPKRVATGDPVQGNSSSYHSAGPASWPYVVPPYAAPTAPVANPENRRGMVPSVSTVGLAAPSFTSQPPLLSTGAMPMSYPTGTSLCPSSYMPATLAPLPAPSRQDASSNGGTIQHQGPYPMSSSAISPLHSYSAHATPLNLSPSAILDRNSPYEPVRGVNTLLRPPPSTSLNQPRKLSVDEIHYQPLGKAAREQKSGVLPYYYQPDAWSYAFALLNNAGHPFPQLPGSQG